MSEDTSHTSLSEPNSVAEILKAEGYHKAGIVLAVKEIVGECFGIHANIGDSLIKALGKTNTGALDLLGKKQLDAPINMPIGANDSTFEVKNSA